MKEEIKNSVMMKSIIKIATLLQDLAIFVKDGIGVYNGLMDLLGD